MTSEQARGWLNVDLGANQTQINDAFKKMARKTHPDKNPATNATKDMKQINEARKVLLDDLKSNHSKPPPKSYSSHSKSQTSSTYSNFKPQPQEWKEGRPCGYNTSCKSDEYCAEVYGDRFDNVRNVWSVWSVVCGDLNNPDCLCYSKGQNGDYCVESVQCSSNQCTNKKSCTECFSNFDCTGDEQCYSGKSFVNCKLTAAKSEDAYCTCRSPKPSKLKTLLTKLSSCSSCNKKKNKKEKAENYENLTKQKKKSSEPPRNYI
jgi:hypothetical protein